MMMMMMMEEDGGQRKTLRCQHLQIKRLTSDLSP